MIAVDTNVLLRYLLRDDEVQAERAHQLFRREERVLVTDVVLVEAIWTLMGRRYNANKTDLIGLIEGLMQDSKICFEKDEVIWRALQAYRESDADFADALIVYKSLSTSVASDHPEVVYTFDEAALQLPSTMEP